MNLLENYIKEVYEVLTIPHQEWMMEEFVQVKVLVDCYGKIHETTRIATRRDWEQEVAQGYFLA